MIHILISLLFVIFSVVIIYLSFKIYFNKMKFHKDLLSLLSKNNEILNNFERNRKGEEIKDNIQLYSHIKICSKISKSDYVTLYKYDYSKSNIDIDFLMLVDDNGRNINKSIFDNKMIMSDLIISDIIKCKNIDFQYNYLDDIDNEENKLLYLSLYDKNITKIYYKNIFKSDEINPVGFIIFYYKDADYVLLEDDKDDILNNITEISKYI